MVEIAAGMRVRTVLDSKRILGNVTLKVYRKSPSPESCKMIVFGRREPAELTGTFLDRLDGTICPHPITRELER